jgi:hypothetical protein
VLKAGEARAIINVKPVVIFMDWLMNWAVHEWGHFIGLLLIQ